MATTDSSTEFTLDTAASSPQDEHGAIEGKSPWVLAWRRLRRNYVALGFLAAVHRDRRRLRARPVYANHIAHIGPERRTTSARLQPRRRAGPGRLEGRLRQRDVHRRAAIPVGPQLWHAGGKYVFGADNLGRDVAVRLLYGGLNSLKIGIGSALICTLRRVALRPARRLLRRLGRLGHLSLLRPDLGVPGASPRDRARNRALDQRLPPLRHQHPERAVSGFRRS